MLETHTDWISLHYATSSEVSIYLKVNTLVQGVKLHERFTALNYSITYEYDHIPFELFQDTWAQSEHPGWR